MSWTPLWLFTELVLGIAFVKVAMIYGEHRAKAKQAERIKTRIYAMAARAGDVITHYEAHWEGETLCINVEARRLEER